MILKIFSVFDVKANFFSRPQFFNTRGEAIRAITDAVNDSNPGNTFAKYPEDFILFEIGIFDDSNASIVPHKVPENVGSLTEFKNVKSV